MTKIALLADELTRASLAPECRVMHLTPANYPWILRYWKPDLLLVESAWHGLRSRWKYGLAAYPDHPERSNRRLTALVARARDLGIPTVFWNKEDSVHFDRFIESARLFEHVFTVDELAIPRYRAVMPDAKSISSLMFAVQPRTHGFKGFHFRHHSANFVGSYSHHIHDARRHWQHMLFQAATDSGLGLTAYDRNSQRKSTIYRYPDMPGIDVRPAVSNAATAHIYRDYLVSLNVNTVENSPTMFSRRLVEILGCGGIAVTTPALAVDRWFSDYCYVVRSAEETRELFDRLRHGPSPADLERARAGAEIVARSHCWHHRLEQILTTVFSRHA